jgi:hypothetical protein
MSMSTDMTQGFAALAAWRLPADNDELDALTALSERSLKEVKSLTEYEDNKAQRVLAAVAFLAAFAAGIFAVSSRSLIEAKVLAISISPQLPINWLGLALFGGFALYGVLLLSGAGTVLYAIAPRFNVPSTWKPAKEFPSSFLFFKPILEVAPEKWVNAFAASDTTRLRQEYIKNSVIETYLVADKIRTKMVPLTRGVNILTWSIAVLLLWLPFALLAIIAPTTF